MTSATIVEPKIQEFVQQLNQRFSSDAESIEIFRHGSQAEKLERVLIVAESILQPNGNFVLLNADLTFRDFLAK